LFRVSRGSVFVIWTSWGCRNKIPDAARELDRRRAQERLASEQRIARETLERDRGATLVANLSPISQELP
jgi:hypothetical protein